MRGRQSNKAARRSSGTGANAWLRARFAALPVLVGATALLFSWSGSAVADVPLSVSAFPTPTVSAGLDAITLGPDGNLWFTETTANRVARITPSGAITEFPLSTTPGSEPGAITVGPDGALWFVEPGYDAVGRITTAGVIGDMSLSGGSDCYSVAPGGAVGIASGADGNIWVSEDYGSIGGIARVNVASGGAPTDYCLTSGEPGPIVPDPVAADSALWFTIGDDEYSRITTTGSISPGLLSTASSAPSIPIVNASDGNLWLGIKGSPSMLDRLTTTDVVTPFDLPSGSAANPGVLASGPDGQLWTAGGGGLTSVTTAGAVNTFAGIYPAGDTISGIAAGPSDTLWLVDSTDSTIYRVTLGTSATISSSLLPLASVASSSAVVAGTISVPAGDLPTTASYSFQYGTSTAYGTSSAPATATATSGGTSVSTTLTSLAPHTTYHYRLVVTGCAPLACTATSGDQSFTTGISLTPVLNQTVAIAGISGKVLVRLAGRHHRFVRVTSPRLVPLGAEINARHGHVLIDSATAAIPQQVASGQFSDGLFTISQPLGSTTTVLRLDSTFKACPKPRHGAFLARSTVKPSHKVVNQVFGNAHGAYTTRGQYAAAADEGTGWHIADRCDGTYVAVTVGIVQVSDLVRHRSFVLTAGQHYLAKPR